MFLSYLLDKKKTPSKIKPEKNKPEPKINGEIAAKKERIPIVMVHDSDDTETGEESDTIGDLLQDQRRLSKKGSPRRMNSPIEEEGTMHCTATNWTSQ